MKHKREPILNINYKDASSQNILSIVSPSVVAKENLRAQRTFPVISYKMFTVPIRKREL